MARAMRLSVAGLCFLLVCGFAAAQKQWTSGIALHSFEPETEDGPFPTTLPDAACGYGIITEKEFPGFSLVGISKNSTLRKKPMGGCGTCIEVRCVDKKYCAFSNTTAIVKVYDECDECAPNELNLNAKVFGEALGVPLSLGRAAILYREVSCPVSGNIIVSIDAFRTEKGGWIRLALENVAGSAEITSVQLAKANNANFIPMENTYGARWELSKLPTAPFDLRVVTSDNQTLVIKNAVPKPGATGKILTTSQFKA